MQTKEKRRLYDEIRVDRNVRVPMRDGVTLSADIYRPVTADHIPAIVVRSPYGKTSDAIHRTGHFFAEHGYAYIYMDVRGRGDSDGLFVPYRNEGRDGYDSIEWAADQPWCTGNVGTMGGSYLGRIQWLTALTAPPHLRAMITQVSPSDPFVEWPTGVPTPHHLCWLYMTSGRVVQNMDVIDWEKIYWHLPLNTMDVLTGRAMSHWREEIAHDHLDDWWNEISYQSRFEEIDLPVLHISGWYDDEQVGTPLNFAGMTRKAATAHARNNQKLLMGPWPHAINQSSKLGEIDFGPDALIDLEGYQRRWFDYWLKGVDTGIMQEPPVRLFVMGKNEWRDEREWPLQRTKWTHYYLHSRGKANSRFGDGWLSVHKPDEHHAYGSDVSKERLDGEEAVQNGSVDLGTYKERASSDVSMSGLGITEAATDRYHYDPYNPVPFITDMVSSQIGGPDDYAAIERRDDVLVYSTEPLDSDTEVTGPVRMELYAASTATDTDFMVKLLDVWPNGYAQRLTDGMVRARFRDGMARSSLIEPGKVYRFTVDCWNTSHVFKRGHRIRVEVSSSAFPKYDRNLNTGAPLGTTSDAVVAEQTIYHDADHPSAIILPIIED